MIRALLNAGADIDTRVPGGDSPLHAAAHNPNPAVAALLIEAGVAVDDRGSWGGRTPLHVAAQRNRNAAVVDLLLAAGAEVDAATSGGSLFLPDGTTPLHQAARWNANPEVTRLLVEAGAAVDARDEFGRTPLSQAAGFSQMYADDLPHYFERPANLSTVRVLLAAGAGPNGAGATPLWVAARLAQGVSVATLLLQAGVDANPGTDPDTTPLHAAPRTLQGAMVSPALFPLLRTAPHLGRLFVEEDARDGAGRVALLSHGAWTTRYGADPGVIGASLDLDGEASTIVGVLPAGFSFPSPAVEVWTPLVVPAFEPGALGLNFPALGRLRPGVTPERAAAEADTVLNADRSPSDPRPRLEARVIPLQEEMVGGLRPALVLLSAVTALVLVIACINVAGLLLAHGVARRRELAVRGALGAGRSRIVRQLLTESVVLGVAGGMLGLAAAALILRAAPALALGDLPRLAEVGVDGAVLAFVAGLSVVAGLVLGAVPALSWSRLPLLRALGEGSPRAAGGFRILSANRLRAALAVTQVGLALVLLVGAGLLLRGFVRLVSVDPGYDAGSVLTATVNHPDLGRLILAGEFEAAGESAGRFTGALRERLARMEALPAIEAVGLSTALPFIYDGWPMPVLVPGRPEPANPLDYPRARVRMASGWACSPRQRPAVCWRASSSASRPATA